MKRLPFAAVCVLTVFLTAFQASAQSPIVYYSFNNTSLLDGTPAGTNNFLVADVGSSISTFSTYLTGNGVFGVVAGTTVNAQSGYVAGNSVSWNNWGTSSTTNRYFQITLDSTGYQGLSVSWAEARSGTGPRTNEFWYSSDGGATFTLFTDNFIPGTTSTIFDAPTNNLSAITALDNNSSVVLRWYPIFAASNSGTFRMDNITVDATVIPEPSTLILAGAGLMAMLAIRRRRS